MFAVTDVVLFHGPCRAEATRLTVAEDIRVVEVHPHGHKDLRGRVRFLREMYPGCWVRSFARTVKVVRVEIAVQVIVVRRGNSIDPDAVAHDKTLDGQD